MELKDKLKLIQQPLQPENTDYMARYDGVIDFVLDKVISDVVLYTHIPQDELPPELAGTIISMASNLIASFGLVNDDAANEDDRVKRVSEGDTSVEYADSGARLQQALQTSSINTNYLAILNKVRRLP